MRWLETVLFGLVAGICEFLPISSQAHRSILLCLFGQDHENPLLSFFIHTGALIALIFACKSQLMRIYTEYTLLKVPRHRRKRFPDAQSRMDIMLLRTTMITMLLGFLLYPVVDGWSGRLYIIALMLFLNGLILHIPMYLPIGNKDSRAMSRLDAILIGLAGAISVIPGISRVATTFSVASARGADLQQAYKWSILLCLPALAVEILLDIFAMITGGLAGVGFVFVIQCILAAVFAYLGAYAAITLMRSLVQRTGLYGFSYYCVGAALFAFILYLI